MNISCIRNYQAELIALVLHPYYKLAYIRQNWGGAAEQEKEHAAGNRHAINWQDEAEQVLEKAVLGFSASQLYINLFFRWNSTGKLDRVQKHAQ